MLPEILDLIIFIPFFTVFIVNIIPSWTKEGKLLQKSIFGIASLPDKFFILIFTNIPTTRYIPNKNKKINKIVEDLYPAAPPGQPAGVFILNSNVHLVVPCVPPGRLTLN